MKDDSDSSACCSNSDFGSDDLDIVSLSLVKDRVPKISGRKTNVSEARWNCDGRFAGMAEVLKVKGQLMRSTGIVRQGRVYLHIEEVGYLMQREALRVITGDSSMSILDLYQLIITGEFGCSWDAYKVYLELKTLGYIVGRHNVPWASSPASPISLCCESQVNQNLLIREHLKDVACNEAAANKTSALQDSTFREKGVEVMLDENERTKELHSLASKFANEFSVTDIRRAEESSINVSSNHFTESVPVQEAMEVNSQHKIAKESTDPAGHWHFDKCQSEDSEILKLMFDVFVPNTQFKKTFPGTPEFSVCIQSDHPPRPVDIQALEAQNGGISVRIAAVDGGRVSFFQYNTVQLPCMP